MTESDYELSKLECIIDGLKEPGRLGLAQLMAITDEFSDARIIGQGGCGAVYKGILGNRTVAVKRLFKDKTINDEMFESEVGSMMMVNHKNIVQFLGFCSDTQQAAIKMGVKVVFPEIRERLLCFEYIKWGSLRQHIKDEFRGLNWHERYQIIEGICEGLHYLHKEKGILHMDLKPDNILLGDNLVPKITDFGLARLNDKSQTGNEQRLLSLGYCAPEYVHDGKMSFKLDIYSLGVIVLQLVTGSRVDPNITQVLRRWRNRWNKSSEHAPLLWYQQVTKCLDLAQWCKREDPTCRPYIWDIISELKEIDRWNGEIKYANVSSLDEIISSLEDMIGIEPLEMHIPLTFNKPISFSIKVTNDTDDYFAFQIVTTSLLIVQPAKGVAPPRSTLCATIIWKAEDKALLLNHCSEFSVQSFRIDGIPLSMDITTHMFEDTVGKIIDNVNVTVVFDKPPTLEKPQTDIDSIKRHEADKASGETHLRAAKESLGASSQVYQGSEFVATTVPDGSRNKHMSEVMLIAMKQITTALEDKVMDEVKTKLCDRVTNLRELPDNLENLRKDLGMMNDVTRVLHSLNLSKQEVQRWIIKLQKVAFRVDHVMNEYSIHSFQLQKECSFTWLFKEEHYAKAFRYVADEVVEILKDIKKVKELLQNCSVVYDRWGGQSFVPLLVQNEDLVGFKENQDMLVEWLDKNEWNSTVITVSGMGGLGKSTLVANVYERVKNSFRVKAWISVSQAYTIDNLLRELLLKIGYTKKPPSVSIDKMDTYMLKQEIRSILQGSDKCLVVLDDVWERDVYERVQDIFKNLESSCVIITTRNNNIASVASFGNHLQLQPLDRADALRLFYAKAFCNTMDRKCPLRLENIAAQIVERCHGLPLVLVSMASLMSSKLQTEHDWNKVLMQFQSELSKVDDVHTILDLSYNDLPGNLRKCFLYCSLFPEDYSISRENIVRLWVAEGFAVATENDTPENVAELNLMELVNRNLLQVVDYDEFGSVGTCKMHGIVRDLALSTASMEKLGSANHHGAMLLMDKDVCRVSSYGWKDNYFLMEGFPRLHYPMSFEAITCTTEMLDSIFLDSPHITVLNLEDSGITEVPASIQNLFNLRYIGLRRTRVKALPECIRKLSNLQTVDIKQTNIETLPQGIVKVNKLRHLLADRVMDGKQGSFQYFMGVKAPKDLSNLLELQTLETVEASDDLADQLEKMNSLRSVQIGNVNATNSGKLFATLSKMPLLSSLLLSACDEEHTLSLEAFNPESGQLHKLIVRGRWAAGMLRCPIFHGHGRMLKYLALSWSGLMEDPLPLLAPHVPNLAYLSLNRASSVDTLVVSEGSFPKLMTLVLKNLPNVNQIIIGKGAIQSIEGLYVVALPCLDKVPQDIQSLTSLKRLWLLQLHEDFKVQWDENVMHKKLAHVPELRL